MKCFTVINDSYVWEGFSFTGDGNMGVDFKFLTQKTNFGNQFIQPDKTSVEFLANKGSTYYHNITPTEVSYVIYDAIPARILTSSNQVDFIKPEPNKKKINDKNILIYWAISQTTKIYGAVSNETLNSFPYYLVERSENWFEILFVLRTSAVAKIFFKDYAINLTNKGGHPQLGHLFPRINP